MTPFKIALAMLTMLNLARHESGNDDRSRSLAHFPVVGILSGCLLVFLDQAIAPTLGFVAANAVVLAALMAMRFSRRYEDVAGITVSRKQKTLTFTMRFLLLATVPGPLRWISLVFMTSFSSAGLALLLKILIPQDDAAESVLWVMFIVLVLAVVCGPLGLFVFGCSVLVSALLLRSPRRLAAWFEDAVEFTVLASVSAYIALAHFF